MASIAPKRTWEGLIAGVVVGMTLTLFMADILTE